MEIENKNKFKYASSILLVGVIFFGLGYYLGLAKETELSKINTLTNTTNTELTTTDFSPFWKTWNLINEKHPNASKVNDEDRLYGAIAGLVQSLDDPYSVFFDPQETKSFEEDIAGNFSGVGMEVGIKDKILTVISPLKNTPAYRAGMKAGDKILKIDDKITSDMKIDEAIKRIRGEKGTTVTLSIFREGEKEAREIKIVRDIIDIPTLETEILPDGIFVIRLFTFSANSTDLFRNAIIEFEQSKADKLIFDLRGNPGGYLEAANEMASYFLPKGKTVVIEDYGGNKEQEVYRSLGYDVFNDTLKFVVLIDHGSASASEIFAGAMQDYKKALLVGEQSYGKGSVQEVVNVTKDTILKVTVAKWLTPNGTSISDKGLTPDVEVEFTNKDIETKNDPQMKKAIELLKNWKPIK